MRLKHGLILMTLFAVISDALLIPFYPQFFQARYGEGSPWHVGAYVAFISIVVMCVFPLWVRVARRFETLHILQVTQGIAAALCLASYWAPGVASYWVLSMAMFAFKSSYLLNFPYLMRTETDDTGQIGEEWPSRSATSFSRNVRVVEGVTEPMVRRGTNRRRSTNNPCWATRPGILRSRDMMSCDKRSSSTRSLPCTENCRLLPPPRSVSPMLVTVMPGMRANCSRSGTAIWSTLRERFFRSTSLTYTAP